VKVNLQVIYYLIFRENIEFPLGQRRVAHSALLMTGNPDAVVVGAGIIGCSLAYTLSKQGRSVLLFERDWSEPDRSVGELLQPGGVRALTALGLRECLEGIDAIPEYGYQVIYRDEKVLIPYLGCDEESRQGRSFHHGRFISNLRKAVRKCARYALRLFQFKADTY
jgi:squalene monooxygenase